MSIPPLRTLIRSNLMLGIAAVMAGSFAAWFAARHIEQQEARLESEARERYATAPYVVASQDLSRGQRIDTASLAVRSMPKAFAPVDAIPPDAAGMLVGGRTAVDIRRGTPVVSAYLERMRSTEKLSEMLPEGMRALTIQVDMLNAISGHLRAGDTVDVFYSRTRGNSAVLMPLLQRVRVLATGEATEAQNASDTHERQSGDFSTVTLLLAVADAQRVVLAEQTGRITLALRRLADTGVVEARGIDSSMLMRPFRTGRPAGISTATPVELLVGGTGSTPVRSWLSPGEGA